MLTRELFGVSFALFRQSVQVGWREWFRKQPALPIGVRGETPMDQKPELESCCLPRRLVAPTRHDER
jgi:hypothetical protein